MSEKIGQLNEEVIKGQIKELVRGSVEETLNELLEQEAACFCGWSNRRARNRGTLCKNTDATAVWLTTRRMGCTVIWTNKKDPRPSQILFQIHAGAGSPSPRSAQAPPASGCPPAP